jgi:hypothetical protein
MRQALATQWAVPANRYAEERMMLPSGRRWRHRAAVRSDDLDLPNSSAPGESRVASGQWGPVVRGQPMCRRVVEPRQ